MTSKENLYISSTPDDVKNAPGLSLITQNTPNGQATQILLEELALKYGTKWSTKLINISTNVQKEECMPSLPSRPVHTCTTQSSFHCTQQIPQPKHYPLICDMTYCTHR